MVASCPPFQGTIVVNRSSHDHFKPQRPHIVPRQPTSYPTPTVGHPLRLPLSSPSLSLFPSLFLSLSVSFHYLTLTLPYLTLPYLTLLYFTSVSAVPSHFTVFPEGHRR